MDIILHYRMEEAERMERRERDKRERAKMSLTQSQEPEPEMPCLFSAPFRVKWHEFAIFLETNTNFFHFQRTSPTEKDRQIQSSLGDFQCLKQLIERDTTHCSGLVGVSSSQIRSQPIFSTQTHILPISHQKSQPSQLQLSSSLVRSSAKQVLLFKTIQIFEQIIRFERLKNRWTCINVLTDCERMCNMTALLF